MTFYNKQEKNTFYDDEREKKKRKKELYSHVTGYFVSHDA